ncbi:AraC family transcriptional regulator [Agrobacterium sp. T29]|uniref:AraC family transcriptional regulator n=1 Tax=Agrobacterium sp. T29 TaxID=2580515 RepID=UPI00115E326A|nr:AraC family transcriptional regulator [Agrobacterium sp. T29]
MVQVDKCKVPQAFWRAAEQFGVPPAALLRQARLPATLHLGAQAFVTTAQYFALMQAIADLSGDPALGIRMVQSVDTAVHPPSSLAAFYARDYRDGLTRLARFKRLCTPEQLQIVEANGDCIISAEWPFAIAAEPGISVDITFATLVELGRRATGRAIVPRRLDLTRPGPVGAIYADYFGCPIRTEAPRNLLVLDTADLDLPFPGHNPEMLEMLTPALSAALGELEAQSSISEQVKIVLKRSLASGQPSLSDVAKQLGMSDRTLQRRITEEGSTFRDLLSEARRHLGRHLLIDPATDIDEVACLLGYQDTTSFYRAFREWEGMPPNRWRESNMKRPHAPETAGLH